jgi:regulator-associated protein of mTOR
VFALGQFVGNTAERTDLANQVDFGVCMMLINLAYDGSPIVRGVRNFVRLHSTIATSH